MNKLVKTVSRTDLYREFLNSLNGILKLTDIYRYRCQYTKTP